MTTPPWLKWMIALGVDDSMTLSDTKHVRASNIVAMFVFVTRLLSFPVVIREGIFMSTVLHFSVLITMPLVLYLNHSKRHLWASTFLLAVVHIMLGLALGKLGLLPPMYLFYISLIIFPYLVFRRQHRAAAHVFALVGGLSLLVVMGFPEFFPTNKSLAEVRAPIIVNTIMAVVVFIGLCIAFTQAVEATEDALMAEKDEQEQLNKRLLIEKQEQIRLNEELKNANEHKSRFLASMSHELRTPLNAILGFTRIVKRRGKKVLPAKQIENLDKVLVSADHLLNLINDILDLAKIEAGHIDVERSMFSVGDLLRACVGNSSSLLQEGVTLEVDLESNLPAVHSDSGKVKQIVLNLIGNAAKFTHKGEIRVVARSDANGLSITIQDTGIGISQEALTRIFDEFQQADTSTTREYGGTGLGLSISYKLAQLLGGMLSVESEEGNGSIFTLHLPVADLVHSKDAALKTLPEEPAGFVVEPTPAFRPRQILSIDDDPDVVYLLQENLKEAGYVVEGATSGAEGLAKAKTLQPFAITLDIMMPQKDGWQTLYELKKHPDTKDIPVIMLSIIDNKQLGYQLGATDFLLKPLDVRAIKNSLARLTHTQDGKPNKRVLLVDHTSDVSEKLANLLQEASCEMIAMKEPESALQSVEKFAPDLVVVDLVQLKQKGLEWIKELRNHQEHRTIPMLVLTSEELSPNSDECLWQDFTRVLTMNQLEQESLLHELRSVLQHLSV